MNHRRIEGFSRALQRALQPYFVVHHVWGRAALQNCTAPALWMVGLEVGCGGTWSYALRGRTLVALDKLHFLGFPFPTCG